MHLQNPDLFAALKQQYGLQTASGPGGSSPFLDSLPPSVRKRVEGLKGVQQEHAKIESEFQLDILALEKKVGSALPAPLPSCCGLATSGPVGETSARGICRMSPMISASVAGAHPAPMDFLSAVLRALRPTVCSPL